MRRCLYILMLFGLLVGCRPESILPPTPTPGNTLPEEATPLVPAETPTAVVPSAPTGAWQFREPRTVPASALTESDTGFALDPKWQIAKVEYVYQWWGLAPEPDLQQQIVQREGDAFSRDGTAISADAIQSFVESVARFQPTQAYVYGNSWTDDYPTHTIELTGEDGQQLLFISTSTGNPGDGPWNLIYNDRLYAQYDGAFGYGLEEIFEYEMRGTIGEMFQDNDDYEVTVHFATSGLPLQLEYGFDGLLPIADSFIYQADLSNQTISGSLVGRSSIGGFGNMVIGTFPSLESITLETPESVTCETEAIDMNDPVGAAWTFTCSVPTAQAESAFVYPITVVLQNDKGVPTTVTGNLSGVWSEEPRPLRLPLPPFLQTALESNADAAVILKAHEYAVASYNASLKPEPPNEINSISGTLTLFGATEHQGQSVLYRVNTTFLIDDSGALVWELTPPTLDTFLAETLALPETQTLLAAYPATTLDLGYFPPVDTESYSMDRYPPVMPNAYPAACGAEFLEEEEEEAQLVRAVGYLPAPNVAIYGGIGEGGHFLASYTSVELDEGRPLVIFPDGTTLDEGYIHLNRSGGWNSFTFGFDPADATEERIARFEALAESIGAILNATEGTPEEYPEWWANTAFGVLITDEGNLQLVECE